ncbi:hypothetical protein LIER_11971 [Lithospermum erythrorhizon]|uniref:Uncharacterized protein n=1 Tax=Lithospermum erythrorhizon TaxID=34254 RepID=A0AAV3PQG7_LITER
MKQILKVSFTMIFDVIFIRDEVSNRIFEFKDVIDFDLVLDMGVEELGITIPFKNGGKLRSLTSIFFFRFKKKVQLISQVNITRLVGGCGWMILVSGKFVLNVFDLGEDVSNSLLVPIFNRFFDIFEIAVQDMCV